MIRVALPALALAVLATPALADDPRLVERLYDPAQVVRIDGKPHVQATIAFAEDEHIENVAIGDSQSWQVTPNKRANLLFVKPLSPTATTNMTVITDRHTYLFDLVASPNARPLYILNFKYPVEAQERQSPAPPAGRADEVELAAAKNPYAIVDPAALNFAWRAAGDKKLLPARVYDDGASTFLVWSEGQSLPAILVKDHNGVEGPVNFAARDETIVIEGVPREIVLRSGNDAASLVNQGQMRESKGTQGRALARTQRQGKIQ